MSAAKTSRTHQTAIRLPYDVLEWLQAEAERRNDEEPGLGLSVSDVIRLLVGKAMREAGVTPSSANASPPPPHRAKASSVQTAIERYLSKNDETAAALARRCGVQPAALSRFRKSGAGLGAAKVAKLAKAVGA
jgi:hypothetical protein